jgi:hypothetical protein
VVNHAFASLGFPPAAAKYEFPMEMFLAGSSLSPIEQNIERVVDGLTQWKPEAKVTKVAPATLTVEGKDYQEAVANMNFLFMRNLWSDGLPLLLATEESVQRMLRGTDLSPESVVGKILPRGGIATVKMIAVSLAMAGGRPEYMPVLIAAVEAILDPLVYHQHMQTTTGSCYPAVIVNGPIAKQIRLNSGYGCLGPSPIYPAGGPLGRALRLLLMNVGGAVPGKVSMSLYGGPARYTGLVFAEDEECLPPGWAPLNVERDFAPGTNTVTVLPCSGTTEIWRGAAQEEQEALKSLENFAGCMMAPYGGYFGQVFNPDGAPGILLIGNGVAEGFAKLGWSKEKVKELLWEKAKFPDTEWLREILPRWVNRRNLPVKDYIQYPMPIAVAPKNTMVVVSGGRQSGHSYWLQVHGGTFGPASREMRLPENWEELLRKAEEDLGPRPIL